MEVEKQEENAAVVKPGGRVDITNSQDLKNTLLSLYDEGYNTVTIDFSNVQSIDSSGLGKLLLFQKKLRERGGELRIVNITNDYVMKMFTLIQLNKVISIEGFENK